MLATWDRDRALLPSCDIRCWRAELGMRHADLLREAAAGIAKPASAPCMILQCGTWYGCVAVWPFVCWWWDGRCDRFKKHVQTFSTDVFDWRIQFKKSSFSSGSASRNTQSKKVEAKKPFFDCVRKADLGFSRKRRLRHKKWLYVYLSNRRGLLFDLRRKEARCSYVSGTDYAA